MKVRGTTLLFLAVLLPALAFAGDLTFSRALQRGMSGTDVKALQEQLLRIPGVFEGGEATGFFGLMTEKAVQKFQSDGGIVHSGTPATTGFGRVGPRTLAKINDAVATLNKKSSSAQGATGSITSPIQQAASSAPLAAAGALVSTTTVAGGKTAATNSSAVALDTTPPIRGGGSPANVLAATTTWVTVSLSTNEFANCYWSNTPNTLFDSMSTAFKVTGGTSHYTKFWLAEPGDYAFFVRCRDRALNKNTSDYPILFSIWYRLSGKDRYDPRVFMSYPGNGDSPLEGRIMLSAAASDNTGVEVVRFFLNGSDLNAEDSSSPFTVAMFLRPGNYKAFAVARDLDGNYATSTSVEFTIILKEVSATSTKTSQLSSPPSMLHTISLLFPRLQLASATDALYAAFGSLTSFFNRAD